MTEEERACFQYGRDYATRTERAASNSDPRMDEMVSSGPRRGRDMGQAWRNDTAWRLGYAYQVTEDGGWLNDQQFRDVVGTLFPDTSEDSISRWAGFPQELVRNGQYVDLISEPNEYAAMGKWRETLLAGLYKLNRDFGESVAQTVFENGNALYPYEMEEAARLVQNGGGAEDICKAIRESTFSQDADPLFPKLRDVLTGYCPEMAQDENQTMNLM